MLKRWLQYLPAGFLLAAVVLAVIWLVRPRLFVDVIRTEQAVEFSILCTSNAGGQHTNREAWLSQEEIEPLLELLQGGTLRFDSRSPALEWATGETMYRLFAYRADGLPEDFYLCTDGMIHVWHDRVGFLHYRLIGCDMDAVETELSRLLGMEQEASA